MSTTTPVLGVQIHAPEPQVRVVDVRTARLRLSGGLVRVHAVTDSPARRAAGRSAVGWQWRPVQRVRRNVRLQRVEPLHFLRANLASELHRVESRATRGPSGMATTTALRSGTKPSPGPVRRPEV